MHEAAQALTLMNVSKAFGSEAIVKNLNISANKGEFITLLGPSGCGKTTTIRLIAGLETLDSGAILLDGADISRLEPNERPVNTVFQNYALFPHLNVYKNISYGLRIKNTGEAEVKKRVGDMLALVKMEGYEKRMPNQLSGGQRQRVAIARALINRPAVLLLDEPLGALDLKLRQHMQQELKRIQRHTSITFIYVTHDQSEALNMSSRIAVMNKGVFEQVGTPEDIYNHPRTRFVAGFVGDRNIFAADVARLGDRKAVVAVHSDKMVIGNDPHSLPYGPRLRGAVLEARYTGSQRSFSVLTENGQVVSVLQYNPAEAVDSGEDVYVGWRGEDGVVIDGQGGGE